MFADLIKIIIPSLLVFLAGYLALRTLIKSETNRQKNELLFTNQKITLPLRLQAYERLILFMERISPESLLVRVSPQVSSASELHSALLDQIRSEWEHNLSQQLYIGNEAWNLIKNSKENIIKLINICADKVSPNDTALALSQQILEAYSSLEVDPSNLAIDYLKKEAGTLL